MASPGRKEESGPAGKRDIIDLCINNVIIKGLCSPPDSYAQTSRKRRST